VMNTNSAKIIYFCWFINTNKKLFNCENIISLIINMWNSCDYYL
jgi:hypothetical protein